MTIFYKIIGKWRLFWKLCPLCNSDAPKCYSCPVCLNDRAAYFHQDIRATWWDRYVNHFNKN